MNVMSCRVEACGPGSARWSEWCSKGGGWSRPTSSRQVPMPRRARLVNPRWTIDPGCWLRVRPPRTGMGPALALSSSFSPRVHRTDLAIDRSDRARRRSAFRHVRGRDSPRPRGCRALTSPADSSASESGLRLGPLVGSVPSLPIRSALREPFHGSRLGPDALWWLVPPIPDRRRDRSLRQRVFRRCQLRR
jgi:hypothetical protein